MDTPSIEQVWNAVFSSYGQSSTHRGIFREVYGEEYPEEAAPLSYLSQSELQRVAREIRVGASQTIGDLGCGRGGPGLWVARATGADLIGVDLFPAAVAEAKARADSFVEPGRARFEVGDLTELRFAAATFDAAMSIAVLWSIPRPEKALAEIARVLRPGGRIGISDIVAEDWLSPGQRAERGSYAGCIAGALSVSEFREGLEAVGLTDVSITPSHVVTEGMISAIIKASKPADARPLIDLSARREMLPVAASVGCCGGEGCC